MGLLLGWADRLKEMIVRCYCILNIMANGWIIQRLSIGIGGLSNEAVD